MIDTHAHLDDDRFRDDLPAVLERAVAAGMEQILTIGIDVATSRAAVQLASTYPLLRAVVGIQPNHVADVAPGDWEAILELVKHPIVVGIGETGLDRYWDRAPFPLQEEYFSPPSRIGPIPHHPVVIHCREAEADVVKMLRNQFDQHGSLRGVMHSFCGDVATAKACLDMGLHISFAGMVTFKNNQALRQVAATIPPERLLIETDSPYLAPMPASWEA